ncbi:helix-turn-helix transcriptional regulator [Aneurinibacillus aneurinilyticus]|uniref:helix-turn-helix transcriptional regulator n=1 Tax=Aneurinibacillus aneurinilyticus TaxID=1391 RepID=UPI002E1B18E4|nr:helix-turn-helix transcriptional regulator [Aneurinibacillus aneurinilyticus]
MKNKKMIEFRGDKTQREVATELGIPVSTYAMIEGRHRFPRKELQAKLAQYYSTTVDELFFSQFGHVMRTETNSA